MKRIPSFCNRPGFPAGLQVLLLPCDSLPPSSVGESLQLFRDAAYEVTEAGDWKQASGLLEGGQSFDVVLAQASDFFAASEAGKTLRAAVERLAVVLLAPTVEANLLMKAIKAGAMDVLAVPCAHRSVAKLWQLSVRKRMELAALRVANPSQQQEGASGAGGSMLEHDDGDAERRARSAATGSAFGSCGGSGAALTLGKAQRGPSWTSMLILPQPEVSQAMAASAQAIGGHNQQAFSAGAATSVGFLGRVTRPRSRLGTSAGGSAGGSLQPPGRWGTRGSQGGAARGSGGSSMGSMPPPPAQWGASHSNAKGSDSLPSWCLGPLDDIIMMTGGDVYDDALLSDTFDMADDGICQELGGIAGGAVERPASCPPAMMLLPGQRGMASPHKIVRSSTPQVGLSELLGLPSERAGSEFTSLHSQLEQLQQTVAREAREGLLASAFCATRFSGDNAAAATSTWVADFGHGAASRSQDGSTSPNTSGSVEGSSTVAAGGPIGLKLRKSASLLDLVARRCHGSFGVEMHQADDGAAVLQDEAMHVAA